MNQKLPTWSSTRSATLVVVCLLHVVALWFGLTRSGLIPAGPLPVTIVTLLPAPRTSVTVEPSPLPMASLRPKYVPRPPIAPPLLTTPPSDHALTSQPEASIALSPVADPAPAPTPPAPAPAPVAVAPPLESVIPPRADASQLNNPAPVYPAVSRRLREEGRVLFDVYILADGTVGDVRLKKSSGYPRLDEAALTAVKQWRYLPARRGNEPIPYWYVQPLVFQINA